MWFFLLVFALVLLFLLQERVMPVLKWIWARLKKIWKYLARPPGTNNAGSGAMESVLNILKSWWTALGKKLGIG